MNDGDTINISWTNTSDYDILSLGIYSTTNTTATWLISNSQSNPTSYNWTVDAAAQGFDLTVDRLFTFYICKDQNFSALFVSPYFLINDASTSAGASASSSPSSSVAASSTPTSTGSAATSSASASSSSSGLSGGAIAGIVIGVGIGVLGLAAIFALLSVRQRRKSKQAETGMTKSTGSEMSATNASDESAYDTSQMQQAGGYTTEKADSYRGAQEMPAKGLVELGSGGHTEGGRVELPATPS